MGWGRRKLGMKTKKLIEYSLFDGYKVMIPKGTEIIPAANLPQPNDSDIAYWAEPWKYMSERAQSHYRTYGFGVSGDNIENL